MVVPLTVKSPVTTRLSLIVVVPVTAPIEITVAAPPKFIVVAVAFNRSKDVDAVTSDVPTDGLVSVLLVNV